LCSNFIYKFFLILSSSSSILPKFCLSPWLPSSFHVTWALVCLCGECIENTQRSPFQSFLASHPLEKFLLQSFFFLHESCGTLNYCLLFWLPVHSQKTRCSDLSFQIQLPRTQTCTWMVIKVHCTSSSLRTLLLN